MPPPLTERRLLQLLADGSAWKLPDLSARLGVSDSTATRLIDALGEQVLQVGERRGRRYFGRRKVDGVAESPIPVFRVVPSGASQLFARLFPIGERGYYVHFEGAPGQSRAFEALPYFLQGMAPVHAFPWSSLWRDSNVSGPGDVHQWTGDDVLRYLVRSADDAPGDFIVGEEALERYLAGLRSPAPLITPRARKRAYARLGAEHLARYAHSAALGSGPPRFLAQTKARGAVSIQFSPPRGEVVGRRVADLLVAQHCALETLRLAGFPAAASELIEIGDALYLEVSRIDRPGTGRRGLLSLSALRAESDARGTDEWPAIVESLIERQLLPAGVLDPVRLLWAFGRLIGSSNPCCHSLAFFTDGATVTELAPVCDMSPSLYAPYHGHVLHPEFAPPLPDASDGPVWAAATQAASFFWELVSLSDLASKGFRSIARANMRVVKKAALLAPQLPR